jgi:hypothetical protein
MMRPIAFWALALAFLAATAGLKIALAPVSDTAEPDLASETLRRFVTAHSRTPVTATRIRPLIPYWSGWRFSADGCAASAYPAPRNGELDTQIRAHAGPGDRVAYIFRGRVGERPPPPGAAWDYAVFRLLLPFGLADPQAGSYVILIHPATCDAPEHLPWSRL